MAYFVLRNNYFDFNGQIKQQISTTSIGTKFAPPYACLFIDKIETAFLETQELQLSAWFRYIDNIFFIWTHGEQDPKLFCITLMSFILISDLHMSQAKKALHFLTLKLVLKSVRLLQVYVYNLLITINISITSLLVQTTANDLYYLARLCALVACALMKRTL